MTLIDKQTVDFAKSKGTFIRLTQQANGITYFKQILVFGPKKNTVLLNRIYPETSKNIEAEIKASLLSTTYNESQTDSPLDAIKFSINLEGSGFKFAKYMTGSLIYTADGQIPTDKRSLIVGNSDSTIPCMFWSNCRIL
ncbi:MAG: hypothetical protein JWQ96_1190 [Segetibacter sp.]|nr:hypothetical protein [Segetibacter sp.]